MGIGIQNYTQFQLFPKQIYLNGVLTVCLRTRWVCSPTGSRCADQLLCAGCGLGDTCYRLVYAKWSLTPLWLKKHNGFDTLCLPDTSRGPKSIFGKNIHMLGSGCTLCFGTFQIHLSSQNVYVNDLGMTGPIFRVPGQN